MKLRGGAISALLIVTAVAMGRLLIVQESPQVERRPASLPSAGELIKEFNGLEGLNTSLKIKPGNLQKSQAEHQAELKRLWPRAVSLDVDEIGSHDAKTLARLCRRNVVSACEKYYRAQRSRYYSALERADSAAFSEGLARVRAQLGRLAKLACLNGNPFVCQDAVDDETPEEEKTLSTIEAYCDEGRPGSGNYCMVAGFELMNRWMQKKAAPWTARADEEDLLAKARAMMAKACRAGSLESCSELVQGPMADLKDRRTRAALRVFVARCERGDSVACVIRAAAGFSGDRRPIADAVQSYCETSARQKDRTLTGEEMSVCLRLQARTPIDAALWRDMTTMTYEGKAISLRALLHLGVE